MYGTGLKLIDLRKIKFFLVTTRFSKKATLKCQQLATVLEKGSLEGAFL